MLFIFELERACLCRPHNNINDLLCVLGVFSPQWSEGRLDERVQLACLQQPGWNERLRRSAAVTRSAVWTHAEHRAPAFMLVGSRLCYPRVTPRI